MEPAHQGLPHLPLPGELGEPDQSLGPLAVNQGVELPSDDHSGGGLFGSLESLLGGGSKAPEATAPRGKSSFDQVQERAHNR